MGICCAVEDENDNIEVDLPAPSLEKIADKYQRFELSLPFCRTKINHFAKHIDEAERDCGSKGYVTVEAMGRRFRTPAWNALRKTGGPLKKLLASNHFKDPAKDQTAFQMDADYLKIFGLLYCGGSPEQKAHVLYELIQDGGMDQHTQVAAEDKDFPPVFKKLVEFASTASFDLANLIGEVPWIYNDDEVAELTDKHTILREEHYLDVMFGMYSRLQNDDWMAASCKKENTWIFSAPELRKKLFMEAGIDQRHHMKTLELVKMVRRKSKINIEID